MERVRRINTITLISLVYFLLGNVCILLLLGADDFLGIIFHAWSVFFIYSALSAVALASFYYLVRRVKQIFPRINPGGLYMLGALIIYGGFICGFFVDESHRFFDVRRSYLYLTVCILASALLNLLLYFKTAKSEIRSKDSN
jgi:hypothetical protein